MPQPFGGHEPAARPRLGQITALGNGNLAIVSIVDNQCRNAQPRGETHGLGGAPAKAEARFDPALHARQHLE